MQVYTSTFIGSACLRMFVTCNISAQQEAGTLRGVKRHKLADGASETDNGDEELSDKELSELVGVSDNVEIQVKNC